ncbi:MAG: hypothetical protein ACLTTU_13060, partial [Bilophila wadsworthia]
AFRSFQNGLRTGPKAWEWIYSFETHSPQRLACFHLSVKWSIDEKRNTLFFSCQDMALHPMAQAGKGYGCSIRRKAR